jgi:ATP-binding cassette subfamily B protein
MAIGFLTTLGSRGIDLLIPLLFKRGIDGAADASLGLRDFLGIAGIVAVLASVSALLNYTTRRLMVSASRGLERDLRLALHEKLLTLPSRWFGRSTVGDLVSRMTQDIEAVRMALGPGVMYMLTAIFAVGGAFTFMVCQDARLALWLAVPFLLLGLIAIVLAKPLSRGNDAVQQGIGKISARAAECFSGIRVLKVFAGEDRQLARMQELATGYFDAQMKLAATRGVMTAMLSLVKDGAIFTIVIVGGLRILVHAGTIGDLIAYRSWMLQCLWPLIAFGWIISMVQRAGAGMRRIAEVLDTTPEIVTPAAPHRPPQLDQARALSVEWNGVTVRLGGRAVVDRVTLEVPAGSSLGITGPTGSGKTTLVQLVARLLDPDEGTVRIGGIDAREWDLDTLRRAVGFVPQETFLFSDLLRENLRFGNPDATEEVVIAAAHGAGLEPDLATFPAGLDTRVGERGVTLSGGQRQRATIARALLSNPPVVVLDDALSAVDAETEARILSRLKARLAGRTAIIVSHRVAALAGLDRIAVLEDGRLAEIGMHDELVQLGGRYARLKRDQELLAEIEAL